MNQSTKLIQKLKQIDKERQLLLSHSWKRAIIKQGTIEKGVTKIILHFYGSNSIFVDYTRQQHNLLYLLLCTSLSLSLFLSFSFPPLLLNQLILCFVNRKPELPNWKIFIQFNYLSIILFLFFFTLCEFFKILGKKSFLYL